MTTDYLMTLKKALCRPVQIGTGLWATSDVAGTDLSNFSLPEAMLLQNIFARKLDGFQGVRGSIVLRLQATANPFQQGIVKLCWYPMQTEDTSFAARSAEISSWSYWPNVEINLGRETACELRIPFTIPATFCDLVTTVAAARPQMGTAFVRVYSQLKSGPGTSSVGWNLYARWSEDDLELFNPTPNSFQSGGHKAVSKATKLPADHEMKPGSISASLAAGATLASVASAVPVLADVAGPTAWALRVASRVASALGFARPPIDEKPRIVSSNNFPYNSNVEGPDVSMPLALTIEPSLKIEPRLGSRNEDEMTVDFFLTKFGYRTSVNVDSSAVAGTVLFNANLSVFEATVAETSYPKPYQILGKLFRYWRGNFRFRIKFVKTKMHTMRLMFAFLPGVTLNTTLAACEYVHREIVDIASTDELVYELPFTAAYPYLNTVNSGVQGSYGSFQVLVVNELQAPASVSNNIDFIVETAMGEGAEFFEPAALTNLLPTIPVPSSDTALKARLAPPKYFLPPNAAQSGGASAVVKVTTLSDAKVTGHQTETSQLCVGEKLLSLRQLIKYPSNLSSTYLYLAVTTDSLGQMPPCFFQPFSFGATTPAGSLSIRTSDILTLLGPYYRFSRGGMRVRGDFGISQIYPSFVDMPMITATAKTAANPGMLGADSVVNPLLLGGDVTSCQSRIWKYLLPAWQTAPMVPHHYAVTTTPPNTTLIGRQNSLSIRGYNYPASTPIIMRLSRQPADDYELICFLGPPLFTVSVS